jgi:choloylglycine hydrolase
VCTRIFWNTPDTARVVGRTLDWEVSDEPMLWHLPAGATRDGAVEHAASWTSCRRSLVTTFWDLATSEGVNDAGLSAHVLYLEASDLGERDGRPGVSIARWAQFVLDNFASVSEALDGLADVQVVDIPLRGQTVGVHLSLEDAAGDSAVVEHVDGELVVHHGREFTIMANDPTYDQQLASLARYRPWGGTDDLPGDILSPQRFARASYFLEHLPPPADEREAVAGVLGVTRNVSVPFGAPYDNFSVYPTWWASVTDVTHAVHYFQSTRAPNVIWVDLHAAALADATEALVLDPGDPSLSGDVSDAFTPAPAPW